MKHKDSDNVLKRSTLRLMSSLATLLVCTLLFMLNSCAEESRNLTEIPDDFKNWYDLRTLKVTETVKDTLQKSSVTINQEAVCINTTEGIEDKFSPLAYITITLDKELIEIASEAKLPIKLQKSYLRSKTPYKTLTQKGADIVKIFEFDDLQVATVAYGYRYDILKIGGDSIEIPHIEIDDITYVNHKITPLTNNDNLYRVIPEFKISYSDINTTEPQQTYTTTAHPWYKKHIKEEPVVVTDVTYEGRFIGCPIEAYEVTETVTTNKNSFKNTYKTNLSYTFKAPEQREQATLDSLFSQTSTGSKTEETTSSATTPDGFTIKTKQGRYVSSNKSKNGLTTVESTIVYTYEVPVKLNTEYGTYTIPELNVSFEELGFVIEESKRLETEIVYNTLNLVRPKLSTCNLDALEERVILKLKQEKPEVVKQDSTYTLKGNDDIYTVEKKINWSDGSTTTETYSYTGYHSINAIDFGEVITTSLNWNANSLVATTTATKTEEKSFGSSIKMVAKYSTRTHTSKATNNSQEGVFSYSETAPIVTFIDGSIKKEFPKRSYVITDLGAKLNSNPTEVVKNSISYDAYEYDHTISYKWNNEASKQLTSNGTLLIVKDKEGEPVYEGTLNWSNNTAKIKVVKTIPHTQQKDEQTTYETSFTVSLKDLTDDKIYADNTSFGVTQNLKNESTSSKTDGYFKINSRKRSYDYVLSNSKQSRTMSTEVVDATITFNDGKYTKDFDVRLNVKSEETLGNTTSSGEYNVTPHKLKLTLTSADNKKTLTTTGTTNIYVKKPKATYEKEQTWNGKTTTIKVKKTTGSNVETYSTTFSISMTDLNNGDIYASNTNFSTTKVESKNTTTSSTDGHFTVQTRTRVYDYKVSNTEKSRTLSTTLKDGEVKFDNGEYTATFDVKLALSEKEEFGNTTESGNYQVTPHKLKLTAKTVDNQTLSTTGITNIYVEKASEPETPHLGKPKSFIVTATYDPTNKITRRAFCFNWDDGVTYAVCEYETLLPNSSDFKYKVDTYDEYNSVAYTQGSWVPAKGVDDKDALRWYSSNGTLISGIDKAVTCKTIGWKNVNNGKYSLIIKGYTYEINGYTITVTAPNGEKVSFNSHYTK